MGFAAVRLDGGIKAGKEYEVMVYAFGKTSNHEYAVTLYAADT